MNNLKKVLALVVAVAMLASFGFVASAANFDDVAVNASYADAVNLLTNLGLLKGYEDGTFRPDNTITRAEVAAVMVRMLGMEDSVAEGATIFTDVAADNWASGYVNVAVSAGIVKGMGDGTFAPNAEVTYEQVVKMIVCALGYGQAADANGGYPTGYLYYGTKTGLTKGVSGSTGQAASRATVAKLVYNALEIDLMDQTSISTGTSGNVLSVKEGHTILTDYLELEKIDGVITSTYLSNPTYTEGDNTVEVVITKNYAAKDAKVDYEVDDVVSFVADNTDAATLLGYTVVAYVGENENGEDAIFAVAEKAGKNVVTTIDTDYIVEIEKDEDGDGLAKMSYNKTKTSKNSAKASVAYENVVVNGFNIKEYTSMPFELLTNFKDVEEITFLDNNNDGDFEFVFVTVFDGTNGVEFVVEEIDNEDFILTGKEDENLDLPYDDDDSIITIIKDGRIVEFDDIAENDVVTVLDETVNVKTVYVSSTVVEGTVDEVEDDEYTIAGKAYKISGNQKNVEEISVGDEGIYFINYAGKIAYVDTVSNVSNADYVYVIDAAKSEGDFGAADYLVKVVTAKGAVEVLTIKSKKVDVYTATEELEDVKDEAVYDAVEKYLADCENGGIAKIKTNAAGEITAIYFPNTDNFVEKDSYKADAVDQKREYSEKKSTYGTIALTSGTIVFNIDKSEIDEDGDLEDAVTVSTVGSLFTDGSSYSFVAYGDKKFTSAEVLVTTDAKTAFDAEAPVMVVTSKKTVVSDDEQTYKLTGIMAGQTVSVVVDPDEADDAKAIENGNVIIFAKNASGFATDVNVLFASTKDGLAEGPEPVEGKITTDVADEKNVSVAFGKIIDKTGKLFKLEGVEVDGDIVEFIATDDCNYTVVELGSMDITVKASSASAIKDSNTSNNYYAFVKTTEDTSDEVTDVVVFKGFN